MAKRTSKQFLKQNNKFARVSRFFYVFVVTAQLQCENA